MKKIYLTIVITFSLLLGFPFFSFTPKYSESEIDNKDANQPIFFSDENPVLIGAYYYPEQWPEHEWERDIKKMAEIGFDFTHFGEFAWDKMEPTEGNYSFEWLDRAIALAAKYNLKVILCTPTPTPPAWLSHKYPEILIQDDNGRRLQHGSRQHASWSNPIYKKYVSKIVNELGKRYGNDKRVWGWQLDNEPSHYGSVYDYSPSAQLAFQQWLKNKYSTLDDLNKRWGNSFWSQTYTTFEQIRIPNEKELVQSPNPHALLDFQEFNNQERGNFLNDQAQILRSTIAKNQFITTNYMLQLPHSDPWVSKNNLDFASYTNYPVNSYSGTDNGPLGFRLGSAKELALSHEFHQSVNGYTGIMELQPGQVNWGRYNAQPLPGAVRMWMWHVFSMGSKFICTYRFRQPLFGNEQYHQGIIQTDGVSLSQGGQEYAQVIKELKIIRSIYKHKNTISKAGILWDQKSQLDLFNFPHNQNWNGVSNLRRYYNILKGINLPVEFIPADQALDPILNPFVIVPSIQLVNESMVKNWMDYVERGGTLVISPRTGQKNRDGHLWNTKLQEIIYPLIGGSIEYYDHLPPGRTSNVVYNGLEYKWNSWGEIIEPKGKNAKSVAYYKEDYYLGKSAIIYNKIGKGKVFYIGVTSVNGDVESEVVYEAAKGTTLTPQILADNVFCETRGNLIIYVNYSSQPFVLSISEDKKIIIGEKELKPGAVTILSVK